MNELKSLLTERQFDVAQFAAAGLTNPQIANKLAISQNTVKVHLTAVFTKMGIGTRSELISRFAADSGLSLAKIAESPDNVQCIITVYVPSTINGNETISKDAYQSRIDHVAEYLSKLAGGATVNQKGIGTWLSDTLGLVKEDSTKVETVTDYSHVDQVLATVQNWRDSWSQEAILVTVQPTMAYFI